LNYKVVAYNAAEDWVIGRATVRHTYSSAKAPDGKPWVIQFYDCCRIGGLQNAAHGYSRVLALVDLTDGNVSPASNLPAVVTCGKARACSFVVPAVDAGGDRLRWRLSSYNESYIRSVPDGLTIDADTGVVNWTPSATARLGLYAVQVTIEDLTASGTVKSSVAIDFIIRLADVSSNKPPMFGIPPTPAANQVLFAYAGQPLTFTVQAADPDAGNTVTLNHVGLPNGATFTASAPPNPAVATFSWTPTAATGSETIVTFTATDNLGYSALPHAVTIKVVDSKIRDVSVIDTIPTSGVEVDPLSFTVAPHRVEVMGDVTEVEWRFDTFSVDQVADLGFELVLKDPQPGEKRLVSHKVELRYKDENGTEIRRELGVQEVEVLASIFKVGVSTDKAVYTANETVEIASQIQNLSQFAVASTVRLSIQDSKGGVVATLTSLPAVEFAAGEARTFTQYDFFTGQTYAGSYRAVAELLDAQGTLVAQASAPFIIDVAATAQVTAKVTTGKASYMPGETVRIQDRVRNTATNALLDGTTAVTTVYSPDGQLYWTQSSSIPQITPQGFYDLSYALSLGQAAPGSYRVVLAVHDASGATRATAETRLEVESTQITGEGLRGLITAVPAPVLRTEPLAIIAGIQNSGNTAVSGLPVTLSIIDPATATVVEEWDEVISSIAVDGMYTLRKAWPAMGRVGATYAAVLTARLAGGDKVLGTKTFTIGEKLHSSLALEGRGRLLVLLDPPASGEGVCKSISELRFALEPGAVLLPNDQVQVDLVDAQGGLLDSESVAVGASGLVDATAGALANLALVDAGAGQVQLSVTAAAGYSTLGGKYRLVATHWQSGVATPYESGLIDANCEHIKTGQTFGAYTLVELLGADAPDAHGPKDAASSLTQHRFLEALLKRKGWSYTITANAQDFAAAFESGGYTVYGLFHEQVKLPEKLQADLLSAVREGAGLLYAGYHDQRNGRIEPALGVKVRGKLPKVGGLSVQATDFHPAALEARAGKVVPLTLTLRNVGTAVPGQVALALPEGVTLIDAGAGRLRSDGTLLWPFEIKQNETLKWQLWVRLPQAPGTARFDGVVSVGTREGELIEYGPVSFGLLVGPAP
jgi:hypothetical protein